MERLAFLLQKHAADADAESSGEGDQLQSPSTYIKRFIKVLAPASIVQ